MENSSGFIDSIAANVRSLEAVVIALISLYPNRQAVMVAIQQQIAVLRTDAATMRARHAGDANAIQLASKIEVEVERWLARVEGMDLHQE